MTDKDYKLALLGLSVLGTIATIAGVYYTKRDLEKQTQETPARTSVPSRKYNKMV